MISKVPAHGSGGGQGMLLVSTTVSFAQKLVFLRFLGNHQNHFLASALCVKGFVPYGFMCVLRGHLFYGKLIGRSVKSHAKQHLYVIPYNI